MTWSNPEKAAVQIARKQCGWNDLNYRMILRNIAGIWPDEFKRVSSTNKSADHAGFVRFMAFAERHGFIDGKNGQGFWTTQAQSDCGRMRAFIGRMVQAGVAAKILFNTDALKGHIYRQTQERPGGPVEHLADLDWEWTYKVLDTLRSWLRRAAADRRSASVRTSHGSTFEATGFREVTDSGMFDMDDQIKKAFDAAHIPIHDVNDVALIKVNGHDLPFAALDGNMPPIGSRVYAIGAPEGLDNTLSDGLVSAIRQVSSITLIQTTAPFSHGSSGVPLLSDKGEVIGLTSYISKEGQNLNFAVPAKVVFDLLHENEHVLRRVKTVTVDVETFTVDVKTTKKEVELAKDVEVRLEHAGIKVVNDRAVADAYLSVTYIAGGETDPDGKMIYRIPTTCFNPTFKTNIWLFSRYGTSDQFQSMTMEVIDQLINDWMNANK